jgi:4-amino-4-deoxy-L-arabinose transferase-like glycosyltransferase
MTSPPPNPVRRWELALVVALSLGLLVPLLGNSGLWDPWETHYGEVARRMLADQDWVRLRWENENFRSKPVLTFWMMGAAMKVLGVADEGGFSGEMVSSSRVEWAVRLPFALWGVFGLVMVWTTLARLYSRRAAWLATAVLATCPFYFMVSRQGITDMPSCAMLVGSMALFALAVFDDAPLRRFRYGLTVHHLFILIFAVVVLSQLLYFTFNLQGNRWMLSRRAFIPGPWMMAPFFVGFLVVSAWSMVTCKTRRQAYMYWFYLLSGIAVLAKGPVAPALAGLTILGYLVVTGDWRLLSKLEIPRGVLVALVVCLPWHFAIFMKDGMGWLNEYVSTHLLGRAFTGVFGERGTFQYYLGQLGVGMWPWVALVPGALVATMLRGKPVTREEKLRAMFAVWGILGFAFFAFVQTKFHHYILPAVPALAVVTGLWLDDVWAGRAAAARMKIAIALALFVPTTIDVVTKQERLVHLHIFRYDRAWPYAAPWNIDFSAVLLAIGLVFGVALAAMLAARARRGAIAVMAGAGLVLAAFVGMVMMRAAADHWGQRNTFRVYYKNRVIHGVDLTYYGGERFVADWGHGRDLEVRSVIPHTLDVGDPMKVRWELRNVNEGLQEKGELSGQVSAIDVAGHRFTIAFPPEERARLAPMLEAHRGAEDGRRRFVAVNAERMIAYQLFWRGENFYSGGEIWNHRDPDMQTVFSPFNDADNAKFKKYLQERMGQGRTFWAATEIGRIDGELRGNLPTETAKTSLESMDRSSNKFGVARFKLD